MTTHYTCIHDSNNSDPNTDIGVKRINNCGTAHSSEDKALNCANWHNRLVDKKPGTYCKRRITMMPRSDIASPMLHNLACWDLRHPKDASIQALTGVRWDINEDYDHLNWLEVFERAHIDDSFLGMLRGLIDDVRNQWDNARAGTKKEAHYHAQLKMLRHVTRDDTRQAVVAQMRDMDKRAGKPQPEPEPKPQPEPKLDELEPIVDPPASLTPQAVAQQIATLLTGSANNDEVRAIAQQAARDAIADAAKDGTLQMTVQVKRVDASVWQLPKGQALHSSFQDVMAWTSMHEPVLIKGPAGTGKSMLASQVASALNLDFVAMSLSGGTAEHHFVGTRLPDHTGAFSFRSTPFLDAFENGGVVLLDEVDACDENVLLAINNGIANGVLPVPSRDDRPVANKHEDFRLIAAANTWGTGPSALYAGRNQLDAAFLDRFALVEVDYDRTLEASLVKDHRLLIMWHKLREEADKAQLRRVVSMRGLLRMDRMMRVHDWSPRKCIDDYTKSWSLDERKACASLEVK